MQSLKKPARLCRGDRVAIVSPSWGGPSVFPHRYQAGIDALRKKFEVDIVEMPHSLKDASWIQDHPQHRAADLMMAFADPSIKAIIASIGGDDSVRLLPYLDLDVIANNPKIFMGYSDTTTLHFVCAAAGFSSFYGPSVMAGFAENGGMHDYTYEKTWRALCQTDPIGLIEPSIAWTVEFLEWGQPENQKTKRNLSPNPGPRLLQGCGTVCGPLIGGCVEVLEMIKGSSVWPNRADWQGAILFLETSEDTPTVEYFTYVMRHYGTLNILQNLNGILLGRPGGSLPQDQMGRYDLALQRVVRDELGLVDLPLMTQMDFGHTDPMFVIPYGRQGQIDCERGQFSILESGVC